MAVRLTGIIAPREIYLWSARMKSVRGAVSLLNTGKNKQFEDSPGV